ncbi:hypothetical protein ACFQOZ_10940 [Comamonas endophytica]|uniref:hypothetical protein n=1 Tax=Comamonas endophytica TaxID=2949090 RepID=UPI00362108C1
MKNPTPRQFKGESWLDFSELTEAQKTNPAPDALPHTAHAPLDPVSKNFLQGIKDSYLPEYQYRLIDFKFGKSAYQAMVGALYQAKDKSEAFYSADSVSYAELGFTIPATYAFRIGSTNIDHQQTLKRFIEELHIVGEAKVTADGIYRSVIDPIKKEHTLVHGPDQDAQKIAHAIRAALQHVKPQAQAAAAMEKPQGLKASTPTMDLQVAD